MQKEIKIKELDKMLEEDKLPKSIQEELSNNKGEDE